MSVLRVRVRDPLVIGKEDYRCVEICPVTPYTQLLAVSAGFCYPKISQGSEMLNSSLGWGVGNGFLVLFSAAANRVSLVYVRC